MRQQRRARDGQPAIRTLAEQRGDLVARQRDLFVDPLQVGAGRGHRRARLRGFDLGVETGRQALARQLGQVAALGDRALGHIALREQRGQPRVVARHCGGQQQPRGLAFGFGGAVVRQRRFQRRAVPAPEVEVPGQAGLHARQVLPGAGARRAFVQIGLGEALARQRRIEVDMRVQRAAGGIGHRPRGLHPRQRCLQIRAALHGLVDQRAQLRIAKLVDPVLRRPLAMLAGQSLRRRELRGLGHDLGGVGIAEGGAAGQCGGGQRSQREGAEAAGRLPCHGTAGSRKLVVHGMATTKNGCRGPVPDGTGRRWIRDVRDCGSGATRSCWRSPVAACRGTAPLPPPRSRESAGSARGRRSSATARPAPSRPA